MPVAIRRMAPLLQVYDMPASIAFYRDVLEFEVVDTGRAMLRSDGVEMMLKPPTKATRVLRRPIRAASRRMRLRASTWAARTWMRRMPTSARAGWTSPRPWFQRYGIKQLYVSPIRRLPALLPVARVAARIREFPFHTELQGSNVKDPPLPCVIPFTTISCAFQIYGNLTRGRGGRGELREEDPGSSFGSLFPSAFSA